MKNWFRWQFAVRAACCAALSALVACGGGGGGDSPPPAPVPVAPSPPAPVAVAPSITQQPASQSVLAGGTATFTVVAAGDTPLSYQWLRDGVAVSGATQPTQVAGAVSVAQDSGSRWSVRVANAAGTVTSAEAVLTVTPESIPLGVSFTAGATPSTGNLDGKGRDAYFDEPAGIVFDAAGTAYVSDLNNATIRRVAPDGGVTTLAGLPGVVAGTRVRQDGTGSGATFVAPEDMAMGPDGALYVVDSGSLRRVTTDGVVTTVAAPARLAAVSSAFDGALYMATPTAIYRMVPGSAATLVAGQEGVSGSADGVGANATFYQIADIAVDAARTIYVSQPQTATIRKVAPDGTVSSLAGTYGQFGSVDGVGGAAMFSMQTTLTLDPAGNLWVAEIGSGRFRKVTPSGEVTTPFGPRAFWASRNGPRLHVPLLFGPDGKLYFGVGAGISQIDAAGTITPIAGQDFPVEAGIGPVRALAVDAQSNVAVASLGSGALHLIKYTSAGEKLPFQQALAVEDFIPFAALAGDGPGNLYVSSATTRQPNINVIIPTGGWIDKIAPDGTRTPLASWPAGSAGALAPGFMTMGRDGAFYFMNLFNADIVKWTAAAGPVVLANDGPPMQLFSLQWRIIAVDPAGKVYLMKRGVIQRIENGALVTVAGVAGEVGTADGAGTQARFTMVPSAMVTDSAGNLFVADGEVVRKVTPDGMVSTVAGVRGRFGLRPGALPASLATLGAMAIGPDDVLHVVSGNALVKIRLH
ncbi:hypothetical protein ACFPOE_00200 [Caenimonas terrae]|uniref:Ig-like domain-containing protein n=1 Tax=Caenimonas terrae TaxID=696074 RepID=A0ABW0N7I1_9BURK